jgi:DNA-binding transcriptional LysR family regulator
MEACASGAGIAVLPSYVSEFEDRVVPLLGIKPLGSVRFWLTYTERVRNLSGSQPILHWIRHCFDARHHACFREVYVPPSPKLCLPQGSPRAML